MCTVIAYRPQESYVGRNLDLEYTHGERIWGMPRAFPLTFRHAPSPSVRYAVSGMAYCPDGMPLFYEAVNEHGVYMAGLHFPQEAVYQPLRRDKHNIAPFELIPWVLTQCTDVREAVALLHRTSVSAIPYSNTLPLTPLHWFLTDCRESMAVEPLADGLHVTPDPADVLTNSPRFDEMLSRLADYTMLTPDNPPAAFGDIPVDLYTRGLGMRGLPGDLSSVSRFVRAAYFRQHATSDSAERQSVAQVLHMLGAVAHPRGAVLVDGRPEITVYSSCCCLKTGRWYYRFYEDLDVRTALWDATSVTGTATVML